MESQLDSSSILTKRQSLSISGYCRNGSKLQDIIVLHKLIGKFLIIPNKKLFLLFHALKLCHQLCQGNNYRLTKCLTLKHWNGNINFHLLNKSSPTSKVIINFHLDKLQYNLIYQTSSTLPLKSFNKKNCAYFKKSDSKFRYSRNGEPLKIRINFCKEGVKDTHIVTIKIMDDLFVPLALMSFKIKGQSIENHGFYLEWENNQKNRQYSGYNNGKLLIESYPKDKGHKYSTNLKLQDFADFKDDFVFKKHGL